MVELAIAVVPHEVATACNQLELTFLRIRTGPGVSPGPCLYASTNSGRTFPSIQRKMRIFPDGGGG